MQFSLGSLIRLTAATAVMFGIARACLARFPDTLIVVMMVSFPLALFGLMLLVQSAFLAFSMLVTPSQDMHRRANSRNCMRMTGAGFVAIVPLVYFMTLLYLDIGF